MSEKQRLLWAHICRIGLGADTEKVAYYRPRIAETMKSWSMSYPCDGITRASEIWFQL